MAEKLSQSQIDALLAAARSGEMDINAPTEEKKEKYRKYDFYSPRKFTKDRIKMLNSVFENYTRIINTRINGLLRTACEVTVEPIEEQRYYEFSNALTEGDVLTVAYAEIKNKVEETPVLVHISMPVMLSMIDRWMGGEGETDKGLPSDYSFTDIELLLYESIVKDFVGVLGRAWENYTTINFDFGRVEVNPTLVQLLGLEETVVIVPISLKFPNCVGNMSICLPGMVLTNIFTEIARENPTRRNSSENKADDIFDSLRNSSLEIVAEMASTQLSLHDIFHLSVGDVIDLNQPKDSEVFLKIGGQCWFDGKMGVHDRSMAIKIGETYYQPEKRSS